ncbi:Tetraspanin family-domain-containing protein [Blakeslea trispora]|nr:Tetraspanin family-domain-containing protein [Blakeslea trispora]
MHNKPLGIKTKRQSMQRHLEVFRENVALFHLMTMLVGIILTSIGAYLINSRLSKTMTIVLLVIGILLSIVGFVGSFGAHLEHVGFLNTYSSMAAIGLLSEIGLLGLFYLYRSKLDHYASKAWELFLKQDPQFLMDLENSFRCCGYSSIQDRAVPKTCAITMNVTIGCRSFVETWAQEWHQWITIGVAVLLTLQSIILVISVIFGYIIDCRTREEESDMAALKYQINHTAWLRNRHGYGSSGSTPSLL